MHPIRSRPIVFSGLVLPVLLMWSLEPGCRRDVDQPEEPQVKVQAEEQTRLDFPKTLEVDDEAVNTLISKALTACATRQYDDFRLLWNVGTDPVSRNEFEYGWQAARAIQVVAVEKALLETGKDATDTDRSVVYAFLAKVELDPKHPAARDRPNYDIILMVVPENGQWRLTRAPKRMRSWLRAKVEQTAKAVPQEPSGRLSKQK